MTAPLDPPEAKWIDCPSCRAVVAAAALVQTPSGETVCPDCVNVADHDPIGPPLAGSRLWYLAHPLAGDVERNRMRAEAIYRRLLEEGCDVIAPWLHQVSVAGSAGDRDYALRRCAGHVRRCDGVIAVIYGGLPSHGVAVEIAAAEEHGLTVHRLRIEEEVSHGAE